MLALGAVILGGIVIGGVIGGTIVAIQSLVSEHRENMQGIINSRNEMIRKFENEHKKQIHHEREFRQIFKLFQLEVEQARKIIEEAEYTDDNGKKIKGYRGGFDHISRSKTQILNPTRLKNKHRLNIHVKHWLQV